MSNENLNYKCRVCDASNIEKFKINHYAFSTKNKNWKSFFCFDCGAVSEFKESSQEVKYSDGSYRDNKDNFTTQLDEKKVLPPIDPWSVVSFKRWIHIWKILQSSSSVTSNQNFKMLDYGGYNGFLPYAFSQRRKIDSYVADLDKKGLKMAEFLGAKTIDLSKDKIIEKNFDLITVVHVLEHLDTPVKQLRELKESLSNSGVMYIEVPNLYGFPLADESHKIAFTHYSLIKLLKDIGFKVLNFGYTKTPEESVKFDYYYNHEKENLFVVVGLQSDKQNLPKLNSNIPKKINSFKYNLMFAYAKIMVKKISVTLFKLVLRYTRTFSLFLIYGLVELVTLKLFKISLVNKLFKKK